MYRLLLVDDEPDVLEYFGRIFRENLGSRMDVDVYCVDSAGRALEYFREFQVDVVVSDIQMPGMNGLELYQKLKAAWPRMRLIFLTGYMDFDYAYAAAQDGKTRFLTKLEPVEKIVGTVVQVLEELEQDYREQELYQSALDQSRQAVPLLQNRALGQFLYGRIRGDKAGQGFEKVGISLDLGRELVLLGIDLDREESEDEAEHLGFVQKALMTSSFQEEYELWNYLPENRITPYIWVMQRKKEGSRKFSEILEEVQRKFRKNTSNSISCSYGTVGPPFEEISRLLRIIQSTLGYRDGGIAESILPCQEEDREGIFRENQELKAGWEKIDQIGELERSLETGSEETYFCILQELTEPLRSAGSMNDPMALEIYFQIAVILQRHINLWQLNEKLAFGMETYRLLRVQAHENWIEAAGFLHQLSRMIFRLYFAEERDGMNGYILAVKKYVNENLNQDLTLLLLAEKVHLNASYLSRLFRKMTGEKLYDYILDARMNRAKELILKNQMKVQEVAQKVGYESVQSFHRAFKKYTGMPPVDYRNGTAVKKREEK